MSASVKAWMKECKYRFETNAHSFKDYSSQQARSKGPIFVGMTAEIANFPTALDKFAL